MTTNNYEMPTLSAEAKAEIDKAEQFTSALWSVQVTPETSLESVERTAKFYYGKIKEAQPHDTNEGAKTVITEIWDAHNGLPAHDHIKQQHRAFSGIGLGALDLFFTLAGNDEKILRDPAALEQQSGAHSLFPNGDASWEMLGTERSAKNFERFDVNARLGAPAAPSSSATSKSPSKLSLKPSAIKPSPKSKPKGFPIKNATSTAPSSIGASSTAASSTSTNPVIDGSGPNLTSGLPIPSSLPPEAALQMQKLMEQGGRGHPRDMAMGSMGQVSPNVTAAGVAPQPSPQGMQGMMPRQGKSGPQPQMGGVVGGRRKKIEYGYDTVIHAS
ncbi:hypothetical protein F5877DRAFT_82571 [Lentinula edodes]|nr:hypothetical protein F5877DRAFT_82571 [Lentinula edodes]